MAYDWQSELPALSALSDQAAADAINAMAVQDSTYVFGSFRTLAALLTQAEYNTLRASLRAAADQETAAGGTLLADMILMLQTPGNENGDGGGVDFTVEAFNTMLSQLCTAANLPNVVKKVSDYVATKQPPLRQKYPGRLRAWQIADARQHLEQ